MRGGQLPEEWADKFDFVIINDVLHDSYEVDEILKGVKKVLKPDGFAAAYDPAVSSYHKKIFKDATAQFYLPYSLFSCLPVSSMGPNEGLGIGWGYELRKQKIEEHGFRVVQVGEKDVDTIQEGDSRPFTIGTPSSGPKPFRVVPRGLRGERGHGRSVRQDHCLQSHRTPSS